MATSEKVMPSYAMVTLFYDVATSLCGVEKSLFVIKSLYAVATTFSDVVKPLNEVINALHVVITLIGDVVKSLHIVVT